MIRVSSRRILALVALGIVSLAPRARAGTFDFSYTPPSEGETSLVLTTTDTLSNGFYTITGITGTFDGGKGQPVTGPTTSNGADNLFSPTSPFIDTNGFSFTNGTLALTVSYNGTEFVQTTVFDKTSSVAFFDSASVTNVNPVPTPEPMSLALVGVGILGLGATRLRRGTRQKRQAMTQRLYGLTAVEA